MVSKDLRLRLNGIKENCEQWQGSLSKKEVFENYELVKEMNIKIAQNKDIYDSYNEFIKLEDNIKISSAALKEESNAEMIEMIKLEILDSEEEIIALEKKIKLMLLPSSKDDNKNIIVEIRAAAGGDEAGIFALDLLRMYTRFAEINNWKISMIEYNEANGDGISSAIFSIKGERVYSLMKHESGVHRVQRVPKTESQGRVHTSTSSVVVLPEVDDIDIVIKTEDLKIDTYRSSGSGGQHVNTTDSAIRITHIPTGTVVTSQDGRSQHDNKDKAMTVLKSKIYKHEQEASRSKEAEKRKSFVGSGDRAEKIRTYNYPQNRVTDHRIKLSLNKLESIMQGHLQELIDSIINEEERILLNTIS